MRTAALAGLLVTFACDGGPAGSGPNGDGRFLGVISGRVTVAGTSGESIAGAIVGTSPATGIAFTDAEGRFEIRGVPIDGSVTYQVTAVKEGFIAASAPATFHSGLTSVVVDLPLDVQFRGAPPKGIGNLSVLVTRENGNPIQATVTIRRIDNPSAPGLSVMTDESGRAQFPNTTSGPYFVEASASLLGVAFFGSTGAQAELNRVTFVHLVVHRIF